MNLFDKNEDLYGEVLKVHFVHKLREEVKFLSTEELRGQLEKDREQAKALLSESL